MGENYLFELFLSEQVTDLGAVILTIGVNGLLREFEAWLYKCDLIDRSQEANFRETINKKHIA